MEAIAKHNFDATSQDELGFRKGQVLKVFKIEEEEEGKWIKAEMDGMEGMIPSNYIQIKSQTWFRGEITRAEAEAVLSDKPDGGFLIRISESSPDFSLSVKCPAGVQHFKVLRDASCKFFIWFVKFNSLNELVEYHRTSSIVRSQDVRLKDLLPEYGKALYDFKAEEPGELEFKKGDIITVTNSSNKHWWTGTLRTKRGQFPAKYVTQYKP